LRARGWPLEATPVSPLGNTRCVPFAYAIQAWDTQDTLHEDTRSPEYDVGHPRADRPLGVHMVLLDIDGIRLLVAEICVRLARCRQPILGETSIRLTKSSSQCALRSTDGTKLGATLVSKDALKASELQA